MKDTRVLKLLRIDEEERRERGEGPPLSPYARVSSATLSLLFPLLSSLSPSLSPPPL
jgi:hypothetical protein